MPFDPADALPIWVITGPGTTDFPGLYTVRVHYVARGEVYAEKAAAGHGRTLEQARRFVPAGKVRLAPHPDDDPVIVETWF